MQQESKTEETQEAPKAEQEKTYNDYLSFTDTVLQEALATKKFLSLDLYQAQFSNIKQLIYLAATASTAVAAVIAAYWASLKPFNLIFWFVAALAVCLVALIGCFMYGVFSLRGENGGVFPLDTVSFLDRAETAYKPDSEFGSYEAKMEWISDIDIRIPEYLKRINTRGQKIRRLNLSILVLIGCATAATVALFSITLYERYYEQERAIETSTSTQGSQQFQETYTIADATSNRW